MGVLNNMKNMKSLIVSLALFIGMVGFAQAGGRQGQGWEVTIMTGTALTVFEGRGYLRAIINSSGSIVTANDNFIQCYSTVPSVQNGAGTTLIPPSLFVATAALTPAIMFLSSTTVNSGAIGIINGFNNIWKIGDGESDFVEVQGNAAAVAGGRAGGGLHCRKASASGLNNSDTSAIYWS